MRCNQFLQHLSKLAGPTGLLAVALAFSNMALADSKYTLLYSFTGGDDGGGVYAGVVLDDGGDLYGTTSGGGAYGEGTVFEISPGRGGKWIKQVLHSFCAESHCSDGALPVSGVILDAASNLFGTAGGGVSNSGVTFQLTPDLAFPGGWTFQVIRDSGSEGLTIDGAGNLYGGWGPGKYHAGDIFELSHGSGGWIENVLYSFTGKNGDCCPSSALTFDAAGNLYGTTKFGGLGNGTAYRIVKGKDGVWREQRLHNFSGGRDGQYPIAGLTVDSQGNVYGTTLQGGQSGTVFKLSPDGSGHWKETVLFDFPNPLTNGGAPVGGVTFDNQGNLYGTASAGGGPICSCGVVFKMTPQANGKWTYSVLHRFKGTDGNGPGYNLIFDKNFKHLYGTTVAGGPGRYGVVYEITP